MNDDLIAALEAEAQEGWSGDALAIGIEDMKRVVREHRHKAPDELSMCRKEITRLNNQLTGVYAELDAERKKAPADVEMIARAWHTANFLPCDHGSNEVEKIWRHEREVYIRKATAYLAALQTPPVSIISEKDRYKPTDSKGVEFDRFKTPPVSGDAMPKREIVDDEEFHKAYIRQVEMLARASQMINDWCVSYAADMCGDADVEETGRRIAEAGGTLAYIADFNGDYDTMLKLNSIETEKPKADDKRGAGKIEVLGDMLVEILNRAKMINKWPLEEKPALFQIEAIIDISEQAIALLQANATTRPKADGPLCPFCGSKEGEMHESKCPRYHSQTEQEGGQS